MISQKQGVYQATVSVLESHGDTWVDNERFLCHHINSLMKKEIIAIVANGLFNGELVFSDEAKAKYNTLELVTGYARGLVDNHHRKDTRFNKGQSYEIKNPGSRVGAGDETLKLLKKALDTTDKPEAKAFIQSKIEARKAEIQATKKTKTAELSQEDFDKLPAEVQEALLG